MVLDGSQSAERHLVTDAARECGSRVPGRSGTVFRVALDSDAIDAEIVAMLAVAPNKLIWLEFDEVGWQESNYLSVVDQAIAVADGL